MVDIALSAPHAARSPARASSSFDQTVTTQDPFGLFAREVAGDEQEHRRVPGVNFVQAVGANTNIRLSYSTTVNRPEFRELAEFEFTDVVGNRAVKGNAGSERALIQNVDGRWEMFSGGAQRHGRERLLQVLRQADRARRHRRARNPIATFQNSDHASNFGIELEAGHAARRALLRQRELHVRRFEDHAAARAARRADVARAAARRPVEEPVQLSRRVRARRLLDAAARSTTSATASRTSAPTRRPTSSRRAAARSTWCSPARSRSRHPAARSRT